MIAYRSDERGDQYRLLRRLLHCPHCKRKFYGRGRNVKICSPACLQAERNKTRREERKNFREDRLSELRERTCEHCGEEMPGLERASRRYCSNRCRQAAHRARAKWSVRKRRR